jgi:ABC-type nickel/cobalt efflux system permease component RcnA
MQSKLVGAVGVLSTFVTLDVSQATASNASEATQFLKPQSFAELLKPVPDALALLSVVDEAQSRQREANPQLAQYYPYYHHHHHHHHHYGWGPDYDEGYAYRAPSYGYNNGYGSSSAHERRMQIIWCTQHPGRC